MLVQQRSQSGVVAVDACLYVDSKRRDKIGTLKIIGEGVDVEYTPVADSTEAG